MLKSNTNYVRMTKDFLTIPAKINYNMFQIYTFFESIFFSKFVDIIIEMV